MIRYAILDGLRRKAVPCAYLEFEERARAFRILIEPEVSPQQMPFLLALFAERGEFELSEQWSLRWVRERIVPPNRQNIGAVLKGLGLEEYDEHALLVAAGGRCCQDDFYIRRVDEDICAGQARKTVAAQLVAARKAAKLTQRELALKSGVQQAVISRIESGTHNPTLQTLEDLTTALNLTLQIGLVGRQD